MTPGAQQAEAALVTGEPGNTQPLLPLLALQESHPLALAPLPSPPCPRPFPSLPSPRPLALAPLPSPLPLAPFPSPPSPRPLALTPLPSLPCPPRHHTHCTPTALAMSTMPWPYTTPTMPTLAYTIPTPCPPCTEHAPGRASVRRTPPPQLRSLRTSSPRCSTPRPMPPTRTDLRGSPLVMTPTRRCRPARRCASTW